LLPSLDKAFDLGFISFKLSGSIIISDDLQDYELYGINKEMNINLKESNKPYLEYHHTNIFRN